MANDKPKPVPAAGAQVWNMIQAIARYIDSGEENHNPYDFIEARRLLNTQLPQLVDSYVEEERQKAGLFNAFILEEGKAKIRPGGPS